MKLFKVTKEVCIEYEVEVEAIDWEEAEEIACANDDWQEVSEKERIDCEEVEE